MPDITADHCLTAGEAGLTAVEAGLTLAQATPFDAEWWTNFGVLGVIVFFVVLAIVLAVRELWSVIKPRVIAWLENAAEVPNRHVKFIDQMSERDGQRMENDRRSVAAMERLGCVPDAMVHLANAAKESTDCKEVKRHCDLALRELDPKFRG